MKANQVKCLGFVLLNKAGQVFQEPSRGGFSWCMPGYPGCYPNIFDSTEEAERVADQYAKGDTRIRPFIPEFPL